MAEASQPTSHFAHTDNNDLRELLLYFSKTTCQADSTDNLCINAMKKSVALMKQDYGVVLVSNSSCDLSTHYPSELILLEREHMQGAASTMGSAAAPTRTPSTIYENSYDPVRLRELINKARLARCRVRFPMPVILYKDKLICRSSTLAGAPETYGRLGYNFLFSGSEPTAGASFESDDLSPGDWDLIDSVRGQDIKLLTTFNVGTIVDFMVENKKVKYGVNVTSSEKVDKENRYSNFTMISLPYPGCEFFKKFRDNNYEARSLIFDWSQAYIDANIRVPDDNIASQLRIDWGTYKEWDLVKITQNYMRLMLRYLQESNSGILIHCISGWDRTPLFISLLRISLWADGVVHQSLDTTQLLYLTIAYDWMLFGHHLSDRLEKGEDIFYFCFYMLKHLEDDEFSILGSSRMRSGRLSDRNLERTVKRTDSDLHLDSMLLEMESHGSNMSLNSNSSSISNRSQEPFLSMPEETTNSNHAWITQDLTIPSPIRLTNPSSTPPLPITGPRETGTGPVSNRQRHESASSLSGDGWQFISGTGSFRGSDATSSSTFESNSAHTVRDDSRESTPRLCDVLSNGIDVPSNRKDRLKSLRRLFINIYGPAVGFKFNSGSDRSLGSFFGNIAEKVGFSARNNL